MNKDMMNVDLYKGLFLDEAVSHRVHARIFEIIGYINSIDKNKLSGEDRKNIERVEELSNCLVSELHDIIDYYRNKEKFLA